MGIQVKVQLKKLYHMFALLSQVSFLLNLASGSLPQIVFLIHLGNTKAQQCSTTMTHETSVLLNVLVNVQPSQGTEASQQVNAQQVTTPAVQKLGQQSVIFDGLFPFTQSQLSLALSIQKSKPADISTRGM